MKTLVIDNGAYSIKALYIGDGATSSYVVLPNAVGASSAHGRGIVGSQLTQLTHYHTLMLRRPLERGLLIDAELQAIVWEDLVSQLGILDESDVDAIVTIPHGGLPEAVAQQWASLLTAGLIFRSVSFVSASLLALVGAEALQLAGAACRGTAMVLQMGYSACEWTPYVQYHPVLDCSARVEVGGKLLTNRLKEVLSYTQVNLLEDTWLVNCIKEKCCSVAPSGDRRTLADAYDSTVAQRKRQRPSATDDVRWPRVYRYVLPTVPAAMPVGCMLPYTGARVSAAFTDAQCVTIGHEGVMIPEAIFCPQDVGIANRGLIEALRDVTKRPGCLFEHAESVAENALRVVIPYGGTCNVTGMHSRLKHELSALSNSDVGPIEVAVCGSSSSAIGVLGTCFSKSMPHTLSDVLPLVGAAALVRARNDDQWGHLRASMKRRSGVALKLDVPLSAEGRRKHLVDELMRAADCLL